MRLVVDTNIVVSAVLKANSPPFIVTRSLSLTSVVPQRR
jgi:predicted nucleic acid-binding protein